MTRLLTKDMKNTNNPKLAAEFKTSVSNSVLARVERYYTAHSTNKSTKAIMDEEGAWIKAEYPSGLQVGDYLVTVDYNRKNEIDWIQISKDFGLTEELFNNYKKPVGVTPVLKVRKAG